MKLKITIILIIMTLPSINNSFASHKVYIIHGYGGFGLQMHKIYKSINKNYSLAENFVYPSLSEDIDSVSKTLYDKITNEHIDSVSFVTHSMGALVVRAMYQYIDSTQPFPFIQRIVMIAPPNKGTPVADFYNKSKIIQLLAGPNIKNLTTDSINGASRLPIPDCEVGLILGVTGRKKGFNPLIEGDNDGFILPEKAKLGIEKDIAYVKADHSALTQSRKVIKLTLNFLKNGNFKLN